MAPLSVVVIPARDEEATVTGCLEALAAQTVGLDAFEVILVADACGDGTVAVAEATGARLGLSLTVLDGPGAGSGPARRVGMEAAADRFAELELDDGLIATTDADSSPTPDWLERQLDHVAGGAQVIAGLIRLRDEDLDGLPRAVVLRRRREARARLAAVRDHSPEAGHHHFAGASLGITASVYRSVGGIEAVPALEDERFAQRLIAHGIEIVRAADVVVETAARSDGRATQGLSVDLAVSRWREERRYRASDYWEALDSGALEAALPGPVSVIIPTRDCADTIAGVIGSTVEPLRARGLVDRAVVIDAASADGTAEVARAAGAVVLQQDEPLGAFGPALGKGDAMWRAVAATRGEIVCFLDGDTEDPVPEHLLGLLGPLLEHPELQFVKGTFDRPMRTADGGVLPHEGGRVTELTARPLLNLHFPRLAGFTQPLAGEFAARRELLEQLAFPVGYGVEIAVLIDALERCGLDALAECHLGSRQNRHQSLRALSEMSFAVMAAVERRLSGRRSITGGRYLRPWAEGDQVQVPVAERPALAEVQWAWRVADSASAAS